MQCNDISHVRVHSYLVSSKFIEKGELSSSARPDVKKFRILKILGRG